MDSRAQAGSEGNLLQRGRIFVTLLKERIAHFNSSQKKVFWGLVFFLFINALILVISIVVFNQLMKKL